MQSGDKTNKYLVLGTLTSRLISLLLSKATYMFSL